MPYRVDFQSADEPALMRLLDLGALDAERADDGRGAAILPDGVSRGEIAAALGSSAFTVSAAPGRDADSVWTLGPRVVRLGRIRLVPAAGPATQAEPGDIRLIDSAAFGTGLHATTAMCVELIDERLQGAAVEAMLDVGIGSGVLALAALTLGVPRVLGLDIDADAVRAARDNGRENGLEARLQVEHGSLDLVPDRWPLVVANILAAPLIEMAPALSRRVAHHGDLILSGVQVHMQSDVERAYRRVGMHHLDTRSRDGWSALAFRASW